MTDYSREVKLNHNERLLKLNSETGELIEIQNDRKNNMPVGKSRLDYNNFSIINNDMLKILFDECNSNELKVIMHMVYMSEFGNNSLKPLNDDMSHRELGSIFNLNHKTIKSIFVRLRYLGVYLQLNITECDGAKDYWVLNPYISWKGKLKNDSLFITFSNTRIVKLL